MSLSLTTQTEIADLYKILRQNRKQIDDLTAENKELENRIEYLSLSATEDDRKEEEPTPRHESKATQYRISKELADFLGKPEDTLMGHIEAIKAVTTYIRNNGLQNKQNGRLINMNDELKALLKLDDSFQLTYFNMAKYIHPHLIR
jgi:chromatin remodeling complex protein RSC6